MKPTFKKALNPATDSGRFAPLVDSLLHDGLPREAVDVYCGRNHVVQLDVEGTPVNIKQFHVPHMLNAYVYRYLRKSKAERSYDNALALLRNGFHTPEPIAFAEVHDGLRLGLSYYLCLHLPFPTLRFVEQRPDCEAIMDALGAELAALHKAGIFFRDFSPGNILVENLPEGGYRFYYIDLNRMDFGVTSQDKLMKMFRALIFDASALRSLAFSYAGHMNLDPEATARRAAQLHENFEQYLTRKRALKARLRGAK